MQPTTPCLVLALACGLAAQNQGLKLSSATPANLEVKYNPTVIPTTGVTVEAWVTYDETTLPSGWRWPTVVRQNPAPGAETFMLRVDAGNNANRNLKWFVRTSTGGLTVLWTFPVGRLKTWTHVAGTYDGTTARLIVDGVEVGQRAGSPGTLVNAGNELRIGNGDTVAPIETWHGELDEVRLWPFARTAKEIMNTKDMELTRVPGEVSTWHFNGDAKDSSGTNNLTTSGGVVYAANTLTLKQRPIGGAVAFGAATQGCSGVPTSVNTSWPSVGNQDFGIVGLRGIKNGAGLMFLSAGRLPNPITLLGAKIHVDIGSGIFLSAGNNALPVSRIPLPLPNNPWLIGQNFYTQFFWVDPACSAAQLVASPALTVPITQ